MDSGVGVEVDTSEGCEGLAGVTGLCGTLPVEREGDWEPSSASSWGSESKELARASQVNILALSPPPPPGLHVFSSSARNISCSFPADDLEQNLSPG